jgi:type IV secretory pathway TrbL component
MLLYCSYTSLYSFFYFSSDKTLLYSATLLLTIDFPSFAAHTLKGRVTKTKILGIFDYWVWAITSFLPCRFLYVLLSYAIVIVYLLLLIW